MAENLTGPLPMVTPPTDRPAVDDPLLIQELGVEKRAGLVRLVWIAAWVVGAAVLHLVLDSPFTGATLLVYALPLMVLVGTGINGVVRLRAVGRYQRRLGTAAWRWIAPEHLRFRGRTVVFDLDNGKEAQVRLVSNGRAEVSRQHGVWVISDQRGGFLLRTAGSTLRQPVFLGEFQLPGEPGEPDGKLPGWVSTVLFSLVVFLVEFGLLWLAMGDPAQAFQAQPATVLVVALIAANVLSGIPTTVAGLRQREPSQWHEVPISVTGVGHRRPWSSSLTVRGIVTLPDGMTVAVQVLDAHMDMVASIGTTARLWVADPPKPASRSMAGLPGQITRCRVRFGDPTIVCHGGGRPAGHQRASVDRE